VFSLKTTTLEALYSRAQGAVAYLDETYYAPKQGSGQTFYIVSAVVVDRLRLDEIRDRLLEVVGGDYWHTTKDVRKSEGREILMRALSILSQESKALCWLSEPISPSDREGEAARAAVHRAAVRELTRAFLPAAGMIVYEKRLPGYQTNADARVFNEMRNAGRVERDFLIHAESPANEELLWAPDMVAWSYRQSFLEIDHSYFEALAGKLQVQVVK
jgi:hypothetical protein